MRTEQKKSASEAAVVKAKSMTTSAVAEASALTGSPFLQRKAACACGGGCPRCQENALGIQPKLKVSEPNDPYEQEADRVADKVMRMPGQAVQRQEVINDVEDPIQTKSLENSITPIVQRLAADEEEDEGIVQTKNSGDSTSGMTPSISAGIKSLQGAGRPLSTGERSFFEPRFGHDFSEVRLHTDSSAANVSRQISAQAFTVGKNIAFAEGRYAPRTDSGRRLLAHELTHVIQQDTGIQRKASSSNRPPAIHQRMPGIMLAGAWKIIKSKRRKKLKDPLVTNGQTDEQLLLAGFKEICPLAKVSSPGEISVPPTGKVPGNRREGCRCLRDIEKNLSSLKSARPPATVQVEPHGWSSSNSGVDPVRVTVRHPDDPFSWGYWTNITKKSPSERRHQKPFWQTLAHEVCGHVLTFVRTTNAKIWHSGGRGTNPRDHDPAIENENRLAAEHGVKPAKQRGFQHEKGSRPATGHAGESFIGATITGFQHGSDALGPTNAASVVQSAASTLSIRDLFIEVEGFAHANEGGSSLASLRSSAVINVMKKTGIKLKVKPHRTTKPAPTFSNLPGRVSSGSSQSGKASAGRKVNVYLFHNPRSKKHALLPAKVYFKYNRPFGRGNSKDVLKSVAAFLVANRKLTIELFGRADSVGTTAYNKKLGLRRAKWVEKELLKQKVNPSQIRKVASQGESQTRAKSSTTRWQDRHVEIRL